MGAVAPPAVTEEGKSAPAAMTGIAAAAEAGVPTPAAATKAAMEAEVGVPAPAVPTEAGTPASAVAMKAAAAVGTGTPALAAAMETGTPAPAAATKAVAAAGTGTPTPAAATETVAVADGAERASASTMATTTSSETAAHVPGPSMRPAESGAVAPVPAVASGTAVPGSAGAATTLVPVNPVPKAWGGPTLRWMSREDPPRPLFMLDDAEEWGKWQAVQGRLANVHAALSSVMGELDGVVVPDGQALQECSQGRSDFLRLEWGLWERFSVERRWTGKLTA
ncbi:skin secretory protein xP2-like [Setaria italica]|uniref:skin secretory protein xP2-like n=1 Tax=Setaria italica TaxID=4555 RepID=UPI000350BF83|nr:skin secretory protein xP2-like [Setaria italica]